MIKTFEDAVKVLSAYIPHSPGGAQGPQGMERVVRLLAALGNPHRHYPVIHVGGTAGKGSTATMISSLLQQRYPTVGLHTSPNLVRVNERMKVNGQDIDDATFMALTNEMLPALVSLSGAGLGIPTYFEILTVMTFLYFSHRQVDVAVVEVGMGGTLDGTNVVMPAVAVLTNVGLDHTEILGDTVEEIATDKVGIIKPNIRVVSGVTQSSVVKIVDEACRKNHAALALLGRDFTVTVRRVTSEETVFDYAGHQNFPQIQLSLLGAYQATNAALALRAVEEFQSVLKAEMIPETTIRQVLTTMAMPGRLEIIDHDPLVILDGAHNPDKMAALAGSLKILFPKRRIITVVAIKRGKETGTMIQQIGQISSDVIATSFDVTTEAGETLSYTPEELAAVIQPYYPLHHVSLCDDPPAALEAARTMARSSDIILVTGSLYLVGEIKKIS